MIAGRLSARATARARPRWLIFFIPIPEACERGFSSHGGFTRVMKSTQVVVVQHVHEFGTAMPSSFARPRMASLSRK